jgi:hypothetical protein
MNSVLFQTYHSPSKNLKVSEMFCCFLKDNKRIRASGNWFKCDSNNENAS